MSVRRRKTALRPPLFPLIAVFTPIIMEAIIALKRQTPFVLSHVEATAPSAAAAHFGALMLSKISMFRLPTAAGADLIPFASAVIAAHGATARAEGLVGYVVSRSAFRASYDHGRLWNVRVG